MKKHYLFAFHKNILSFLPKPVKKYEIGEEIGIPFDSSGFSKIQFNTTTDRKLEFIVIENKADTDSIKLLNRDKPKEYLEDYEDIADAINYGWYNPNKNKNKDDFEMDR